MFSAELAALSVTSNKASQLLASGSVGTEAARTTVEHPPVLKTSFNRAPVVAATLKPVTVHYFKPSDPQKPVPAPLPVSA